MQEKRMNKCKESLHDLWDTIRESHLQIIGVPEGEEWKKITENLFK